MGVKRIVIKRPDGIEQFIGLTSGEQPPDMMTVEGVNYCLKKLGRSGGHYLYVPLMSPAETMANFRGDGTFNRGQK